MSLLKNRVTVCNIVCVLLLIAMLLVQIFVPYYTYTHTIRDEETKERIEVTEEISLGEFVWFAKDPHEDLGKHLKHEDVFNDSTITDDIALPHLYILLLTGFALVFSLLKRRAPVGCLFSIAAAGIAVYQFTTNKCYLLSDEILAKTTRHVSSLSHERTAATVSVIIGVAVLVVALVGVFGGLILKQFRKKPVAA